MKSRIGDRLGHLIVISEIRQKGKRTKLVCICSCGKTRTICNTKVDRVISCGCQNRKPAKKKKPIEEIIATTIYGQYRDNARNKGIDFDLTKDQCSKMFFSDCYYCGSPPARLFRKWRKEENGMYNGIDRKDNALGYTQTNTVPCCTKCNYIKNDMHISEFLSWIKSVYRNRVVKDRAE